MVATGQGPRLVLVIRYAHGRRSELKAESQQNIFGQLLGKLAPRTLEATATEVEAVGKVLQKNRKQLASGFVAKLEKDWTKEWKCTVLVSEV